MTYVFVYGTLKKGFGNHGVLGNAMYIDEAVTNSKEFTMFDGGFPFVSDSFDDEERQGSIMGELYETDDEQILYNLDRLEGVPLLYVKKEITVTTLSNIRYEANMYVASPGSNERLKGRDPMKPVGKHKILEWS
jgi:gamma-glutamylaminecyclotransferase